MRRSAPPSSRWVANEWRSVCGLTRSASPARAAARLTAAHACWRASRRPRSPRKSGPPRAGRHVTEREERDARPGHPAADPVERDVADRDEPLLVALADDPDEGTVDRQVVAIESDRLADPESGGIQQLEERPVAQRGRGQRRRAVGARRAVAGRQLGRVTAGRLQEALGLVDGQGLGQQPLRAGQVEVGRDVDGDEPLAVGEAVEALERGRPAPQAARREPGVATPSPAGPRGEVVDGRVGRARPSRATDPARRREVVQVAAIRADRRRGEAAFDVQVGQVRVDRGIEVRHVVGPVSAGPGDPAAPGLRAVEELAGAGQRRGPTGLAAEHLGQLDDPALAVEVARPRSRCDRRARA